MRKRIESALALRQSLVSKAEKSVGTKVAAKATAKGQRSALAKEQAKPVARIEREVWASPNLSFADVADGLGIAFATLTEARQAVAESAGDFVTAEAARKGVEALTALNAFAKSKRDRFDLPFSFVDFERLVRREIGEQKATGINLGLAGYSADDIVQLAVIASWARAVATSSLATKAVAAGEAEQLRVALSRYSLADIEAAEATSKVIRYSIEKRSNGKSFVRELDVTAKVAKVANARKSLALFADLAGTFGVEADFSMGDVYRNIKRVKRQGIKDIGRMLDGFTYDGTFTSSMEFNATEKSSNAFRSAVDGNLQHALTATLEDDFFKFSMSVEDQRADLIEQLRSTDLVPAQAEALAFVQLLNDGYTIDELKNEVFGDLDARQFGRLVSTAQDLFN